MFLNMLASSSPGISTYQSQSMLTNYFLESKDQKAPPIAIPTPGLIEKLDLSGNVGRHLLSYKDHLYAVVDDNIYKIDSSYTATLLGTLGTTTGYVDACAGSDYIMWVDGNEGRYYQISTASFGTITSANFIDTATSCCFFNGFFFTNDPTNTTSSGRWYRSDLNDATTWSAITETASVDGDALLAVRADSVYLILFGSKTIEYWASTASVTVGFTRQAGTTMAIGIAAQYSIQQTKEGGFYALVSSKESSAQVMYINPQAYTQNRLTPISTPALEYEFESYSTISDAFGYVYTQAGHQFYVLTFPTANKTWVYDAQNGSWHQRTSYLPSVDPTNPYVRHRATAFSFFNNEHIVCDLISGKLGKYDLNTFTEFDTQILREIVTSPLRIDNNRISLSDVKVDIEHGIGTLVDPGITPTVKLCVSKDGGYTFGSWYSRNMGQMGQYKKRCLFGRFGQAYSYVFKLQISDPVKAIIHGFYADITEEKSIS